MYNSSGSWIMGFMKNIGECSGFMAELWGLWLGMDRAWTLGFKKVWFESESKAVIMSLFHFKARCNLGSSLYYQIKDLCYEQPEPAVEDQLEPVTEEQPEVLSEQQVEEVVAGEGSRNLATFDGAEFVGIFSECFDHPADTQVVSSAISKGIIAQYCKLVGNVLPPLMTAPRFYRPKARFRALRPSIFSSRRVFSLIHSGLFCSWPRPDRFLAGAPRMRTVGGFETLLGTL
ncbi:hypothetical protein PIB30_056173 [Stylosanthes scabra]|uniref:RNase H type-1 domain-containing protein n=1 Tax=Stylosanthes scabra TaxID=79078 RepID=A0ABU6SJD4_9FABA|nr:hypothetical protein [Stylosanthes scabra]